jgi:hypothetical protein
MCGISGLVKPGGSQADPGQINRMIASVIESDEPEFLNRCPAE